MKLRTRLMLLYAGPFFVAGAAAVTVPMLGVKETAPVGSGLAPPGPRGVHFPYLTWSLSLFVLVLLSIGLGWIVAGRFVRPLHTMTATARDISATNLHRRLGPTGRHDELAQLAATLDALFARLEAAFASQRHFVANASHELRTPLTAERALLQVALADSRATTESLRATCEEVLTLGEHQERLIESLLTLATSERGVEHREPLDLAEIVSQVLARRDVVGLSLSLDPARVVGDPHLVESLVANLVDNAMRHNVSGGWVAVMTTGTTLTVSNTGPVIPAAEVDRLFQPFQQLGAQRTRRGGGHGLGLAIVRAIATAHGAELVARARPEGGLEVKVAFQP